ncbi:hypothetical protein ACZ90_52790 [Streptomyces albus subsp. albus]|nr:hypothetical protein ACZ90_52790 [Streptomyces albus subsp. albus]
MWRELIEHANDEVELSPPAQAEELATLERQLGHPIPSSLRELLLETNGVEDSYGSEIIWDASRLLNDNLTFRSNPSYRDLYMPFDHLVFFGDNGGGDQFAFPVRPLKSEVFAWDHENDSRFWVAPGLDDYLRRTLASDGDDWYR